MGKLKATDVFTPGSFPTHTYVQRSADAVESKLKTALEIKGQVVSLSGPSKSGKTVLVERVVGMDSLITVGGGSISKPEDVWERALDWMGTPNEKSKTTTVSGAATLEVSGKAEVGVLVAKSELGASASATAGASSAVTEKSLRGGLRQVVREIADSDYTILIDDFHYMSRDVQSEVAKQIKEAARDGVRIITAAVPHRADDVVRANPELRGRVMAVDLGYWLHEDLKQIGQLGFGKLNMAVGPTAIAAFVKESAGSPQLMQSLCLHACFYLEVREAQPTQKDFTLDKAALGKVFETTASMTNFRSLVDVLDRGPRTRGMERNVFQFIDGTEGDVYRCVLKAIAAEPLRLAFDYDEFVQRVAKICKDRHPGGSAIVGTCQQMSKLARTSFESERVIEWDDKKSVLDLTDPYLLFYLRWSGRLDES
jgi:hypothetical protein